MTSSPLPHTITLEELLQSNRYAVLATMHDPPRKLKESRVLYTIHPGKQLITVNAAPVSAQADTDTLSTTFFGHCHTCHYRAHSQKHCPLRRCLRCGVFGHAASVCPSIPLEEPNVSDGEAGLDGGGIRVDDGWSVW